MPRIAPIAVLRETYSQSRTTESDRIMARTLNAFESSSLERRMAEVAIVPWCRNKQSLSAVNAESARLRLHVRWGR